MSYPKLRRAKWPFSLPADMVREQVDRIKNEVDRLDGQAQYGWGHTIEFGSFQKIGLLGDDFLRIAGGFDQWDWWPQRLDGMHVADVGCFTGGLSLLMAQRGADTVYAVDELPEHTAQCAYLAQVFGMQKIRTLTRSVYRLRDVVAPGSLDLILFSGVLYHMSDMLVGLYALRELLKPGGLLLIQSNGIDDFQQSYANFGRFVCGRWWRPSGLCLLDMLEFMGYVDRDVRFYRSDHCLARATRSDVEIPFKRGLNWPFDNLRDTVPRSLDDRNEAPVRGIVGLSNFSRAISRGAHGIVRLFHPRSP